MFQEDKWPFVPTRLSEIIEKEPLAVIQAGSSARLGRAITILDYDPATHGFRDRVDSIHTEHTWEPFCSLLRDEQRVSGGNLACQECDLIQAPLSLARFHDQGRPFRSFECHLGLLDATYVIVVRDRPVALLYTGQHRPATGPDAILQRVDALGTGEWAHIRLAEDTRDELSALARSIPEVPEDFEDRLRREAQHIERIAEDAYGRGKYQWEQSFLDRLRRTVTNNGAARLEGLRDHVQGLLEQVRAFCRTEYAIFFASVRMGDTVLAPVAWAGMPSKVSERLPHFNWKKAGLVPGIPDIGSHMTDGGQRATSSPGIRGDNSGFFTTASCLIPATLGNQYRGVLVLGPFAESFGLASEQRFLLALADVIAAFTLTELEVRYLEQERKRWESAAWLLTHQLRTALTPITTQIGRAKAMTRKVTGDTNALRATELLSRTEDLSLRLAEGSKQTLEGHVLQVERSDMEFERYPLSVLVSNVAEGFTQEAEKRHRQLAVDKSVELLPEAEVDVARITIVLSNLLDNAIKYSFPNTTIKVRAGSSLVQNPRIASAVIEIDDLGNEVREDDRQRIFEQGTRGLTEAKMGRIPGTGLGLWEARAVIEAHSGEIGVTCESTQVLRSPGPAFHVVFSVTIPLHQKEAKGKNP